MLVEKGVKQTKLILILAIECQQHINLCFVILPALLLK